MAELVDALVSDASGETRGSSSLLGRTIMTIIYKNKYEGDEDEKRIVFSSQKF